MIIREAHQCADKDVFVRLNGLHNLDLGQVLDVLHSNPSGERIEFALKVNEKNNQISALS